MNNLSTITSPVFGQVRYLLIDEEPFYVAKDVAHTLGYSDTTTAINLHCRDNVSYQPVADCLGRIQSFRVLSKADVIRLSHASRISDPDAYTRWLFDEPEPELAVITLHEENDQFPVSGRELWQRLGIKTKYKDWFPRMKEYGFIENTDFQLVAQKRATNNPKNPWTTETDHNLTISMAKEICMLQRTEQGRLIRRHLIAVEEAWNSPDAVINRALKISNARVQTLMQDVTRLQSKIALDAPKVALAEAVSETDSDIHIGQLAKLLKQNGFDTGRTRLFERLRKDGYLMKAQTGEGNVPTQKSMNMGLMRIKEAPFEVPGKGTFLNPVPMVTGKGQAYFLRRYAGVK